MVGLTPYDRFIAKQTVYCIPTSNQSTDVRLTEEGAAAWHMTWQHADPRHMLPLPVNTQAGPLAPTMQGVLPA